MKETKPFDKEFREHVAASVASLIIQSGAIQEGNWEFASGIKSPVKIEGDYFVANQRIFAELVGYLTLYVERLDVRPDVFVGIIRGGKPFAKALGEVFDCRWAARLGAKRIPDRELEIEGEIRKGDKVLLIEDVLTLGTNTRACAFDLTRHDSEIIGVLSVFSWGFLRSGSCHWLASWWDVKHQLVQDTKNTEFLEQIDRWHINISRSQV